MGAPAPSLDWSNSAIGPVESWPQSLHTALGICLASPIPSLIWWGPQLIMLCNDACRPLLGATDHPRAQGRRGRDGWPEMWDIVGPTVGDVLVRGEAVQSDDQLLLLDRDGRREERYVSLSYSPIRDEAGGIGGVFAVLSETTGRMLAERRLTTLRALAANTAHAASDEEACSCALDALQSNTADIPFALLYLLAGEGGHARLSGATGVHDGIAAELQEFDLAGHGRRGTHVLAEVARTGRPLLMEDATAWLGHCPGTMAAPHSALVLPVGQGGTVGLLVAGLNPFRALDDDYRGFLDLVAAQLALSLIGRAQVRRRSEDLAHELMVERDRLQLVLDTLPEGVLIVDGTQRFVTGNRMAATILGMDIVGKPVPLSGDSAYRLNGTRHPDGAPYLAPELPLGRALLRGETVHGEQLLLRNAQVGRDIPVLVNAAPLRNELGQIDGGVVVFQDITAIRDLDRAREEFLSSAAHDLKTPLTSISGLAQLGLYRLERLVLPDTEAARALAMPLEHIEASAHRMLGMINELLDVARAQMGDILELDRRPADLVALVRGVVAQQEGATSGRFRVETHLPTLEGVVDAGRVERVVGNLLTNALKYSPPERSITVRIARDVADTGPVAVITVRDEGIGIPATDLPYIFERFHRGANVASHVQGTGIGLASAKQIVALHGGTIAVDSVEGAGATFTVHLPLTVDR
jgi:signal transduction histidine kinase